MNTVRAVTVYAFFMGGPAHNYSSIFLASLAEKSTERFSLCGVFGLDHL